MKLSWFAMGAAPGSRPQARAPGPTALPGPPLAGGGPDPLAGLRSAEDGTRGRPTARVPQCREMR